MSDFNNDELVNLLSYYQEFLNKYPRHPYASKAKEIIEGFEREKRGDLSPFIWMYGRDFIIDLEAYKIYVKGWLRSGPYRQYRIRLFGGIKGKTKKDIFTHLEIPDMVKRDLQDLLEMGNLIVVSEAAFKNKDWQGPKFLVFEPKKGKETK